MKIVTIAALAVAQLSAGATACLASELPREAAAVSMEPPQAADGRSRAGDASEARPAGGEALALRSDEPRASSRAAAAEEDPRRKRKSTGDKLLTGAAVVLGIGAVAVAGLLVAIFVN